jgi:hypothetical protein
MAAKKKAAMFERYGKMTERYKTVAAKKKHETTEPKSQLKKESKAEKAMGKGKAKGRNLKKRGM